MELGVIGKPDALLRKSKETAVYFPVLVLVMECLNGVDPGRDSIHPNNNLAWMGRRRSHIVAVGQKKFTGRADSDQHVAVAVPHAIHRHVQKGCRLSPTHKQEA